MTTDTLATELTAQIVASYVAHNALPEAQVPGFIRSVYSALTGLSQAPSEQPAEELTPAVPIRKSVNPEYIVCLEDGSQHKSMKRYLRLRFNLTPEQYREKWGLPADYPMVAPDYSARRSALAKKSGLGRKPMAQKVAA